MRPELHRSERLLYADASAVLAWLLDEPRGEGIAAILDAASAVVSSEHTVVECDRSLLRKCGEGAITEALRAQLSARVAAAAIEWNLLALSGPILLRARLPFAGLPIRALDAIHLASALEGRSAVPGLAILSLDDRMRRAARSLGFGVVPA
jgi:predicted nucleic acid-binding protein